MTRVVFAIVLVVLFAGVAAAEQPSDCGRYIISAGHQVPRPCGDRSGQCAAGATARCPDGSCSYSEHPYARGTCNYHGGVENYLR